MGVGVFHSLSHARIQCMRSLSERDQYYINRLFPSSCFARSPAPREYPPRPAHPPTAQPSAPVRRLSPRFRRTPRQRRRPALGRTQSASPDRLASEDSPLPKEQLRRMVASETETGKANLLVLKTKRELLQKKARPENLIRRLGTAGREGLRAGHVDRHCRRC